ncbi:Arm DNA-binding domain-containing protein [Trinickia sp. Y13]|uniref:Arm DNA-binding domain-containing protein n=1 Tax=Trinickia sp. Y13 TaxID=2917807 RepID=UPI002405CFBD|nr:Arm DNA-binding domain-containing protein [Trinickia sp. Y13]MDG0026655.1 Arm DNA-binding domain-containing protein [Trinickia sp. Y13]
MDSKQLYRLNALRISREIAPGYYPDGGGLYLQISASGARSWIFRYMIERRSGWMGLGPLSAISLAEARVEAARCRKLGRRWR